MSGSLRDLLTARLPFPGLVGWIARLPDRTVIHQCYERWLAPARVEQVLARLSLAAEGLRNQDLEPVQLCWIFENLRLYLGLRADGSCVALFVQNRPDSSIAVVQSVLEEFGKFD